MGYEGKTKNELRGETMWTQTYAIDCLTHQQSE